MRNLSLLLLLFFALIQLNGQEYILKNGAELSNPDQRSFWTGILGTTESEYYFLRRKGPVSNPEIILEKYDDNFNYIFSKNIESSSGILGNSKNHFETLMGNGEIIVCLASWNKEKQESGLWVKKLSLEGESISEEVELLAEKGQSMLKSNEYRVALSKDGSKLAVLSEPTFDKEEKEHFTVHVFETKSWQKICDKKYAFDVDMERYPQNRLWVNNQGVAYAFKTIRISGKEFKYFITATAQAFNFQESIDFADDQLNQSKFIINSNGDLIGIGILAEAKKYNTLWQRTWRFKMNGQQIVCNQTDNLGADLLSRFMNEKKAAKEGASINNFFIKDVLEVPSGNGYLLLTEELDQRKISNTPIVEGQPPTYSHKFRYGGALILSFNNNCNRNWHAYYDKQQNLETADPDMQMGSFAYAITNEQLHLVWNLTEVYIMANYATRFWKDKNGDKIKVRDVFGEEAKYGSFLSSIDLSDGNIAYQERTFSALPLKEIQAENNFEMAIDPSFSFQTEKGLILLSRMDSETPKRIKFSLLSF